MEKYFCVECKKDIEEKDIQKVLFDEEGVNIIEHSKITVLPVLRHKNCGGKVLIDKIS